MWLRAISHFWFLSLWWLPKQLQTERSREVWMSSVKPWEECLKVTNCYVLAGCCMFLRCYSSTLDSPAGSQHWEKTLDFFFSRFRCESVPSVCELLALYQSCIWHDVHFSVLCKLCICKRRTWNVDMFHACSCRCPCLPFFLGSLSSTHHLHHLAPVPPSLKSQPQRPASKLHLSPR